MPDCPHGGVARLDGSCVLTDQHPSMGCPACGALSCPCETCWNHHRAAMGCAYSRELLQQSASCAASRIDAPVRDHLEGYVHPVGECQECDQRHEDNPEPG